MRKVIIMMSSCFNAGQPHGTAGNASGGRSPDGPKCKVLCPPQLNFIFSAFIFDIGVFVSCSCTQSRLS